jgi:hypothetical protein
VTAVERRHAARAPCRCCVGGVVEPEPEMERVHRRRGGVLARIRERRLVVNDRSGSDPRSHDERFVVESADEPADSTPSSLVTISPWYQAPKRGRRAFRSPAPPSRLIIPKVERSTMAGGVFLRSAHRRRPRHEPTAVA